MLGPSPRIEDRGQVSVRADLGDATNLDRDCISESWATGVWLYKYPKAPSILPFSAVRENKGNLSYHPMSEVHRVFRLGSGHLATSSCQRFTPGLSRR